MKSVIEILGGAQILFGISFNIQDSFEEYLTEQHRAFLAMLRVVEEHLPELESRHGGRGRPRLEDQPICRAFLAKSFFQIEATSELLNRLRSDSSLRRICGFTVVPSAATFSRRLKHFSDVQLMERTLQRMVSDYHEGLLVGHINRDSTPIVAREKAKNKKTDVRETTVTKRKRGRPRKGASKVEKRIKRLARQKSMRPAKALRELDHECAWGCKRNSQGNVQFWRGYKLHLDVTDMGIPVTAVVTGANVHDSQVAVPMEKLTASRVTHLYSLMDSGHPKLDQRLRAKGDYRCEQESQRHSRADGSGYQTTLCDPLDGGTIKRTPEGLVATVEVAGEGTQEGELLPTLRRRVSGCGEDTPAVGATRARSGGLSVVHTA